MKKINPKSVFKFQLKAQQHLIASDPTLVTITVPITISKAVAEPPVLKRSTYR